MCARRGEPGERSAVTVPVVVLVLVRVLVGVLADAAARPLAAARPPFLVALTRPLSQ
jgi:hypothetical protein